MADNDQKDLQTLHDAVGEWKEIKQAEILEQANFLKGLPSSVDSLSDSTKADVLSSAQSILSALQDQATSG